MNSTFVLIFAIVLIFSGLFVIAAVALGFGRNRDRDKGRLGRRLSQYSLQPDRGKSESQNAAPETALGSHQLTRRTVAVADRVARNRGMEESLANSLAAASLNLRPGEWMIIHLGCTTAVGLLFVLLSGMAPIAAVMGIGVGFALPYFFSSYRRNQRRSGFYSALPEMLQLAASSLAAGHSLPQAFDAVARGSDGPMAEEISRAMAEARLGSNLEDSLDAIAVRMSSPDMAWIVMAIRIQRDVGGNLAEILTNVASTLRERERLRRQVKSLSAEGRLSATLIGALPFVFAIVMTILRPAYLVPLYTTPLGILMLSVGAGLLAMGILWLRKTVQVEV